MVAATKKVSLAQKLSDIAAAIGDKDPQKHSQAIKFPYHAARDVYGWWRPLLHEKGIVLVPSVRDTTVQSVELPRSGGGTRMTFLTTIVMDFMFIDTETGESLTGSAVGHGEDPADKGSGKAMTYAQKSFLLGFGMNGADTDVEAVPSEPQESTAVQNARQSRNNGRVRVEPSNIEGIERGGRSTNATDVQVQRVRALVAQNHLDMVKFNSVIETVCGEGLDLPSDPEDVGPFVRNYLSELSAERIGELIQYLEAMSDKE